LGKRAKPLNGFWLEELGTFLQEPGQTKEYPFFLNLPGRIRGPKLGEQWGIQIITQGKEAFLKSIKKA